VSGSIAFDRAAGYYDQSRGLPDGVAEQVADRIDAAVGREGRLLELGVGTGRIALPLHRRGRRIVGVDLSVPMLDRYRAKAAALGLPPPAVVRADATRLPFRDACADAVLEVHVLHLVPGWRRALAEARRVLRPGGAVLVGRGGRDHGDGPRELVRRRFEELAAATTTTSASRRTPTRSGSWWRPAGSPRSWSLSPGRSRRATRRRWRRWRGGSSPGSGACPIRCGGRPSPGCGPRWRTRSATWTRRTAPGAASS
jgi:SAM-dependent methyltransferase